MKSLPMLTLVLAIGCQPAAKPGDSAAPAPDTTPAGTTPAGTTPAGTTSTPTGTSTGTGTGTGTTSTGTTSTGTTSTGTTSTGTTDPEPVCLEWPAVVINEVSTSNQKMVIDEDGDSPDWIELYNDSLVPVDLAGWGLSDDDEEPGKWPFPDLTLEPGAHLLVLASGKDRLVSSWDTVIDRGQLWTYLEVVAPPPGDWAEPGFDDSGWLLGPSGFGRSDDDDATVLSAHTVYVRTGFDVSEDALADLAALWLHVDHDDGFVAWLNGEEIARDGVEGYPPAWDAWVTDGGQEAQLYQGLPAPGFDVLERGSELLRPGRNILAVEVHDSNAESSDLSLIPFLTLGYAPARPGSVSLELADSLGEASLHASFKLSMNGEPVTLSAPDGCVVDRVDASGLRGDESIGRSPDGGWLGVFMDPTPGATNDTEWRPGFSEPPVLSPPPGFYPEHTPILVQTSDRLLPIRYTLDGAVPTEGSPVVFGFLDTVPHAARVVRARTFAPGLWPSRVTTGTYIAQEPRDIAAVSLAVEPDDLWDPADGIYIDYWARSERDVHVELFDPDGPGFALDAGIAIHGGASRQFEQKTLRLLMRGGYGTSELDYPLFEDTDREAFKSLLLRNGGHDWLGAGWAYTHSGGMMRDVLLHKFVETIDIDHQASRPVVTFLNGEPWGVYNLRERIDTDFIEAYHGATDIDLLEWADTALEGDNAHWVAFMDTLRTIDRSSPEAWAHVDANLDVAEVANYNIAQIFADNWDWPGNNKKWWRPREPGGKYRFLLYDTDFGLGLWGGWVGNDTLAFALDPAGPDWPNPPWSTELLRLLLEVPRFEQTFANRYADMLNTVFSSEQTLAVFDARVAEREAVMHEQFDRWGEFDDDISYYAIPEDGWETALVGIEAWLVERPGYAFGHVVDNLGLDGTFELTLDADPPEGGHFALSAVTVEDGFSGTYFLGIPVRVEAVPSPGWTFVGWSGGLPPEPEVFVDGVPEGRALRASFE
ncbi:MAG: hypothetical protein ACI8PZ_001796 [Myxococcota bacterium]|jgi:hypothetical protein